MNNQYFTKTQWTESISFFLMKFANVEMSLDRLKVLLNIVELGSPGLEVEARPTTELSRRWHGKTLEQKIEGLNNQLNIVTNGTPGTKKISSEINNLLQRIENIKQTRDILAHGAFAMRDGCTPQTPSYCFFSRAKVGLGGKVDAPAKVLHSDEMELQVEELSQIELDLSSRVQQLSLTYGIDPAPATYELTRDSHYRAVQLALSFGRFVVHMGEIENLVHYAFQAVVDPVYDMDHLSPRIKLNGHWDSLTLSEQINDLMDRLPDTYEYEQLKKVLGDIKLSGLINRRNILCHARACYCLSSSLERLDLAAVHNSQKGAKSLSVNEVMESISLASKFSDLFSEALSFTQMTLMKPIKTPNS